MGVKGNRYGRLSWTEFISLGSKLLTLPLHLAWDLITQAVWNRRVTHVAKRAAVAGTRQVVARTSMPQLQYLSGTDGSSYDAWVKKSGQPHLMELFIEDTKLYWIGPKRTDKIVIYCHGGGFFLPTQAGSLDFWNYVREQLKKDGLDVGFAMLGYSLVPEARFPTQLRQLCVTVDHFLATGTHPSNIILVGDSAGGNLILQFLSQLLHPIRDIGPVNRPKTPLGGAYLMSPWVTYETTSPPFQKQGPDIFDASTIAEWGGTYVEGVPDSKRVYIEPSAANDAWFKDTSKFLKHVLVSAGEDERFKDDIIQFATTKLPLEEVDVQVELQQDAVHNDPYFEFAAKGKPSPKNTLVPALIDWLKDRFRAQ